MKTVVFLSMACFSSQLTAQNFKISGSLENTLWLSNSPSAAFLEFDDNDLLYAPHVSLSFEYQPDPRFYFHGTFSYDKGFDAGTRPDGQFRLDALILRYRPFGDNTLNIQVGKFPTIVGNWVPTHDYYEDPFLLSPLPYSAITGVNVKGIANHSPQAIEDRSDASGPNIHNAKENWSSIIWGPAYSNGLAVFGNNNQFDYAFEIKNTFLGSQAEEWELGQGDFTNPTFSTRLGYSLDASLAFGISASYGPYLNASSTDSLPAELQRSDFNQSLLGLDLRWAHRDWIISGEAFLAHYETLDEDLQSMNYYVQARYKAAPGFWLAGRFGQTHSNRVSIPSGGDASWSPDLTRAELAAGWRITNDLLMKVQYTYTVVTNGLSAPAEDLLGMSLGWKF
ncbi:MAG: hypothetical protein ACSHX0_10510 [Akkermansiaceae bacterium]